MTSEVFVVVVVVVTAAIAQYHDHSKPFQMLPRQFTNKSSDHNLFALIPGFSFVGKSTEKYLINNLLPFTLYSPLLHVCIHCPDFQIPRSSLGSPFPLCHWRGRAGAMGISDGGGLVASHNTILMLLIGPYTYCFHGKKWTEKNSLPFRDRSCTLPHHVGRL